MKYWEQKWESQHPYLTYNGMFCNSFGSQDNPFFHNVHEILPSRVSDDAYSIPGHLSCMRSRACLTKNDLKLMQAFQPMAVQLSFESCTAIGWVACDNITSFLAKPSSFVWWANAINPMTIFLQRDSPFERWLSNITWPLKRWGKWYTLIW